MTTLKEREIRANYDDSTIRVYQAYSPTIAEPALAAGRFVAPFKMDRMTWIKPSFCWMMYRCGYAAKAGQERVLGIDITREGFDWALQNAVLSTYHEPTHGTHDEWKAMLSEAPVRIQWDPERDLNLNKIEGMRSIQIGITGEAVRRYVDEWIVDITDLTALVTKLNELRNSGGPVDGAPTETERMYPVSDPETLKRLRFG